MKQESQSCSTPSEALNRYRRWWEGKRISVVRNSRSHSTALIKPQRVIKVEFAGPPSCTYGQVILHLEDGSVQQVRGTGAHRPRKRDVQVVYG